MTGLKSKFPMPPPPLPSVRKCSTEGLCWRRPEQGMNKIVKEGLSGIVTVDFTDKKTGKNYHDVGNVAGIEVVR